MFVVFFLDDRFQTHKNLSRFAISKILSISERMKEIFSLFGKKNRNFARPKIYYSTFNFNSKNMKKRNVIIVTVAGGLLLLIAVWGASRHFGWFEEPEVQPQDSVDTFVYDENMTVDIAEKTKVFDLIIVDMSASMDSIFASVIEGLNDMVDGLKQASEKYSCTQEHYQTMVGFNSLFLEKICDNVPIDSVKKFTKDDFFIGGATPLYDAMGISISSMMDVVDTLKNYIVLTTIITDGLENASGFYSKALLAKIINVLSDDGWSFSYMGTDKEVIEQALCMNIDSVYYFDRTDTSVANMLNIDENSRVSTYRAIDSIRKREQTTKK